jgi:hypothetical protein
MKERSQFNHDVAQPSGIASRCKDCIKMKNKKYYKANPNKWANQKPTPKRKPLVKIPKPLHPQKLRYDKTIHPIDCDTCNRMLGKGFGFCRYHLQNYNLTT